MNFLKGKFNTSVAQGYEITAVILVCFPCLWTLYCIYQIIVDIAGQSIQNYQFYIDSLFILIITAASLRNNTPYSKMAPNKLFFCLHVN